MKFSTTSVLQISFCTLIISVSAAIRPTSKTPMAQSLNHSTIRYYSTEITTSFFIMDDLRNGTCDARSDKPEPFGVAESVFLALTLGLLIMVMIVGNILVITAIVLERELQRAQYYLVLSLAVADLTVGVVVSPLAALYDINRQWHLGVPMCDFWIVSDVLACTASILHLLAIALDRYWSITDVTYVQKRTPRRIGVMILVVWVVSFCVSVAPILGWKDSQFKCRVEVRHECLISQAVGYQIFSTTTAFYAPVVLICILYWKIYKAAKRRIQMQHKRRSNTVAQLRAKILALQQNQETPERRRSTFRRRKTQDKIAVAPQTPLSQNGGTTVKPQAQVQIRVCLQPASNEPTMDIESIDVPSPSPFRNGHLSVSAAGGASMASSCYSINEECSSYLDEDCSTRTGSALAFEYSSAAVPYQSSGIGMTCSPIAPPPQTRGSAQSGSSTLTPPNGDSDDEDTELPLNLSASPAPSPLIAKEKRDSSLTRIRAHSLNSPLRFDSLVSKGARGSRLSTGSALEQLPTVQPGQRHSHPSVVLGATAPANPRRKRRSKKETAESSRERRAGRTLAIITGIFVVCWAPFFVLALMRPLCGESCPVTEPLDSVFLWLGYVNSAVNPIIYTIFSPDFRTAFKRTLQRFCLIKRG